MNHGKGCGQPMLVGDMLKGGRWLLIEPEDEGIVVTAVLDGERHETEPLDMDLALAAAGSALRRWKIPYEHLLVDVEMDKGVSDVIYSMLAPLSAEVSIN